MRLMAFAARRGRSIGAGADENAANRKGRGRGGFNSSIMPLEAKHKMATIH